MVYFFGFERKVSVCNAQHEHIIKETIYHTLFYICAISKISSKGNDDIWVELYTLKVRNNIHSSDIYILKIARRNLRAVFI